MSESFSFKKGWDKLPKAAAPEVRARIMEALGLKTVSSFYPRLNGAYEPKMTEAKKIEAIFSEYGITDIWGR